ncbi:Ger(x)C family spore germination protein [Alicyclobacillus dauci]|uniref:Ger(X)C family spore germination protein n=1 Tax=Alicyclobacillus dauci TaxID=1475485 RepID=A0ABY6Z2R5_9BACL|nr:Ger(x)C family spore germination protein [Alicyclobacillus dauci]WAH36491.1 Ger(x)C family spore germination protein [Alicyclobacillus dauci]
MKKPSILGALCLLLLFLPGCWDYEKINDRAQVIGMGVDPVEQKPGYLSYTFQIPVFDVGQSKGDGQSEVSSSQASSTAIFRNFTIQAHGVEEAISIAQTRYENVFYLSNLSTVILNRQLTQNQVQRVVSELIRIVNTDKLAWLLVTPQSAKEILSTTGVSAPSDMIERFLGSTVKQQGYTTRTRLWEFWRELRATGMKPHTGLIRVADDGLELYGLIAFDKTRPSLELSPKDTVYFNLVSEKIERFSQWVQDKDRAFQVSNIESHSHLSVTMQNQVPVLHAKIHVTGIITQDESEGLEPLTEQEMRRYEKVLANQDQQEAERVLKRFQQNRLDAYGFGEYVLLHNLATERYVQQQWAEAFAHAKPDIQVNVTLLHKGSLT